MLLIGYQKANTYIGKMNTSKGNIILFLIYLIIVVSAKGQCPTSGTITTNCTTSGNLTISSTTLNVNAGVTVTVTGRLTIQGGAVINGSGATFNLGSLSETWGSTNTLNGGTYNTSRFDAGSGGLMSLNNVLINTTDYIELVEATVTNSVLNVDTYLFIGSGSTTFNNAELNIGLDYPATGVDVLRLNGGATVNFDNGTVADFTGDINAGNGADVFVDNSIVNVTGDFDNRGGGILEVTNDGELTIGGDFDNSGGGNTSVDDGAVLVVEGDYNNGGGGSTDVNGGTFFVGGTFTGNNPTGDAGNCSSGNGGCCGAGCAALPVTLIQFSATTESDHILLKWSTATEENNDFFTLERSHDGIHYEEIATVEGYGTTSSVSQYEYVDFNLSDNDYLYYRLSQTDYDGTYVVLKTVIAAVPDFFEFSIYPNPAKKGDVLQVSGVGDGVNFVIQDNRGQLIQCGQLKNQLISTENLDPGHYIIRIDQKFSKRFIIY